MTEHLQPLASSASTSALPSAPTSAPCPVTDTPRLPRFALGQVLATPGALALLSERGVQGITLLQRHVNGDWGAICAADAASNEEALQYGSRLLSSYTLPGGGVIWIITEADRSATTLLMPREY